MAKLYWRHAPMNSGKSTDLVQAAYIYRSHGKRTLILKPESDTKSPKVVSRAGHEAQVHIHVKKKMDLYEVIANEHRQGQVSCVFIDEAQFLQPKQVDQLLMVATLLDIPVIAYGLRTAFDTKAFPASIRLYELANSVEEVRKTICPCERKATFNARKVNGKFVREGEQEVIDGQGAEYLPLCAECYLKHVGLPNI